MTSGAELSVLAPGRQRGAEEPAIEVTGLRKEFRRGRWRLADRVRGRPDPRVTFAAVDDVTLNVERGEIFGILGPNGAGKTTTARMLSTLLLPTSGSVRVFGVDAVADPKRTRTLLGAMLGGSDRSVYWKLTGRENLEYFAALYHLPRQAVPAAVAEVLETMALTDRADDYAERYSTGMRQRLALARALLPRPPLLLLDEPSSGLDPHSAAHLRECILGLRDQGKTVVLTTHNMEEAEQLCDRVAIIDHGRVSALGSVTELKRMVAGDRIVQLVVACDEPAARAVRADLERFAVRLTDRPLGDLRSFTLHCDESADLVARTVQIASHHAAAVVKVDVLPVTLEDVFLTLTGRELRE